MKLVRSHPDFERPNVTGIVAVLQSDEPALTKQNQLQDLPPDILFELCTLAGIDTTFLPVRRKSIFPTSESMVQALICHSHVSAQSKCLVTI